MECSPPAEDCAEVEDVGDAVEEVIGEDHAAVEVLHFLFACCILNVNLRNIKITIEAYLPLPPLLSTAHRIHLAGSNGCKQLLEPTVGNMRASPPAKTTDPTGNLTTVEIKGYEENIKTIAVDHSKLKKTSYRRLFYVLKNLDVMNTRVSLSNYLFVFLYYERCNSYHVNQTAAILAFC